MNRRSLIKGAAVVPAVAAATALAAPAISQGMMKLRMTTSWPKGFPGLGTAAQAMADNVTALTDGRISVEVFGAGEIAPGLKAFDAVSDGTADMYHSADYYYLGKSPALAFFTAVPFGMTASELDTWLYNDGGQALWDEVSGGFGVKPFVCGNSGVQAGGWFNKEINSADDLKGLNIRMPGLGGEALRRIGANAVTLSGGEIGPALQAGTIDATEWVGPWNDYAFGLQKLAKIYYTSGFHEPGSGLSCGVNKGVYDKLSDSDKAVFAIAAQAANAVNYTTFLANNGEFLQRLQSEGTDIREFGDDVWDAFGKASDEVMQENAEKDPMFKKVHDSFTASRAKTAGWVANSEGQYLRQRNRVIGL
ncbi:MAG: TRAP transporter substrate-binding protein [Alphaproteobacteria bacterium]